MQERSTHDLILWFFLALFIVSIFLLGKLVWPFLSIIIIAAVLAGIFNPVYKFFLVKDKINPPFASFLTCVLIFFFLSIPLSFFISTLLEEARELYTLGKDALINGQVKNFLETSKTFAKIKLLLLKFNVTLTTEELFRRLAELGQNIGVYLFDQVKKITANMLSFIVGFFFILLVTFYLLIDGSKFVSFIIDLSPLPRDQDEKLIRKFKNMAGAILIGNGLGGLIQGVLGGIVFSLFGLKSPLLWGLVMSILAFLPIIGVGVVFIPAAIYLFVIHRIGAGIFFIIFYIILSGGIEYLFKPRLVGERVKMHTLLVFLSIVGGLKLFGVMGIIYGPLVVTAFLTLTDIYRDNYQKIVEPH